jgi:sensor histidine kinase YesM
VENAVVHGIATERGPGRIEISASRDNGTLHLRVRDSGPGFGEKMVAAERIGLGNTRARLAQLYGDRHSLECLDAGGGGAAVTIAIPFRREGDAAGAAG